MRLTTALHVRQLLAKLQPTFPASARESQQLLNVLDTSFRKHLDDVHPAPNRTPGEEHQQQEIPLHSVNSSSSKAHHHLQTLLTHPLLEANAQNNRLPVSRRKHAVERYQKALSQGRVQLGLLKDCIKEYCTGLRNGEIVGQHDKFGPQLAAWVSSTSPDVKEAFFLSPSILDPALKVMMSDQEETTVWIWLKMVYERDFGHDELFEPNFSDSRWLVSEDALVSSLMRFSIRRNDLDDAAHQYAEACRYRFESGRTSKHVSAYSPDKAYVPMTLSWNRLAASIILTRTQHGISASRFDTALEYGLPWSRHPFFNEAILNIYHPTAPSAQLMAMSLRNSASRALFTEAIGGLNGRMSRAILTTVLDGAQLSVDQNMSSDADLLLEIVSSNFPDFKPMAEVTQHSSLEEQMRSIWKTLRAQQTKTHVLEIS